MKDNGRKNGNKDVTGQSERKVGDRLWGWSVGGVSGVLGRDGFYDLVLCRSQGRINAEIGVIRQTKVSFGIRYLGFGCFEGCCLIVVTPFWIVLKVLTLFLLEKERKAQSTLINEDKTKPIQKRSLTPEISQADSKSLDTIELSIVTTKDPTLSNLGKPLSDKIYLRISWFYSGFEYRRGTQKAQDPSQTEFISVGGGVQSTGSRRMHSWERPRV